MTYPYTVNTDTLTEPADSRSAGMAAPEIRALKTKVKNIYGLETNNEYIHVTSNFAVSANARNSEAHNLSAVKQIKLFLECISTEMDYAVGDIIEAPYYYNAAFYGALAAADATNLRILQQGVPAIPDRSGTGTGTITAAKWEYFAVATSW